MIDLLSLEQLVLPGEILEDTHVHLQKIGERKVEGVALWAGAIEKNIFYVQCYLIPEQRGVRSYNGMYFVVEGPELYRINKLLYENKLTLIAQIHTHPQEAFHSPTDDDFALVTTEGAFSLVIPNLAKGPPTLSSYAIFRMSSHGMWEDVVGETLDIFRIE